MIQSITLVGAGNLATQLGKALQKAGLNIVQVYSQTEKSACQLGTILKTGYVYNPTEINIDSDLLIIAIKDDAIDKLLSRIDLRNSFVVHTAGSIPMNIQAKYSANFGVFYPLQTFSKNRDIEFSTIPICLEANSADNLNRLKELAFRISREVKEISSEERKILHLGAVFACNFVNHFYNLSDQLLTQKQLSFDLLKPLITESAAKVMELKPYEAQTGPAVRYDESIINMHLKMLADQPELEKIYSFVTENIHQSHKLK